MNKDQLPATQRDSRLDVLRAIALITIFINHVPGNFYEAFTSRNFGFSDAAETFVLISGIAVGLAYGTKFLPGNRLIVLVRTWRRAITLYVAHVMATMATIAIFAAGALWYSAPELMTKINLTPVFQETPEALLGIVTLGHQLGYNNILTMYAAVMIMVPGLLYLASRSLSLMLGVSAMIWLLAGLYRIGPPHYPNDGLWFLNPLSWQFLFAIGIAGVLHVRRGGTIAIHPWLVASAIGWLLFSLVWVKLSLWGLQDRLPLPFVLGDFNKTFLTLPRLLHVLAMAYVFLAFPFFSRWTRCKPSNPLAVMGRHGLAVFVAGTVLSMAGQVIGYLTETGFVIDTIILSTGIALQFALAYYLEWEGQLLRRKVKAPSLVPQTGPAAAAEMPEGKAV
ncbi:OpgC family protein [Pararhizobium haloflavum]|uniref:OpgC family protein n=1 Tax=Pararhizobium haloflavum TaxID=2037914 RepID=UPI000C1A0D30|nr:OpgC domain-containing protein [Pararhizobium haloflavum]